MSTPNVARSTTSARSSAVARSIQGLGIDRQNVPEKHPTRADGFTARERAETNAQSVQEREGIGAKRARNV